MNSRTCSTNISTAKANIENKRKQNHIVCRREWWWSAGKFSDLTLSLLPVWLIIIVIIVTQPSHSHWQPWHHSSRTAVLKTTSPKINCQCSTVWLAFISGALLHLQWTTAFSSFTRRLIGSSSTTCFQVTFDLSWFYTHHFILRTSSSHGSVLDFDPANWVWVLLTVISHLCWHQEQQMVKTVSTLKKSATLYVGTSEPS